MKHIFCGSAMETFVGTRDTFGKLIKQTGDGKIDRYIYNQEGEGLGNFFGKITRFAKPLLSSAINTIKPELRSLGNKVIETGTSAAISGINKASERAAKRIKKSDNLDG